MSEQQNQQTAALGTAPVGPLLFRLALPTITAQVVNLLRDYQQAEGTSYLFIAHDLSMVRYVSDDIGVMYLGQLVESSDSEEIYKNPLHPYTKGLLSCIPIADPKLARA